MTKPRANFNNLPYTDSFTDIDKKNTILQIGNTDYYEDVFNNIDNHTYIETICELVPKYSFNNTVQVTFNYNDGLSNSTVVKYSLYDNSVVKLQTAISSIDIVLLDTIKIKNNMMKVNLMITK